MSEQETMEATTNSGPSGSTSHQPSESLKPKKDSLLRLLEKQAEEIANIEHKIETFTNYRDDYQKLKSVIYNMQDKVKHPHRIPIAGTQLAYLDGHIIHTNELHVLLGDNYFALRSARQADKIIDRRVSDLDEKLKQCLDAKKKFEDWSKVTQDHKREKEEFVEIIETM